MFLHRLPIRFPGAVTASRSAQPIADLLADVTVIGRDEIVRSGAQSLTEVLQRQPGVEITMNGGPGSTSGAFLRGANRGQTLVLIDGLRVGSSSVGATSLEAIPLDQIERVEILRGPASSLYGADAIGGVIQVFTKRAQDDAFAVSGSAGYGTYETRNASATVRGAMGPLAFSLTGGGTRSSGFNAIVNPDNFSYNPSATGIPTKNVSGNAVLGWAAGQEVSVQYFRNRLNNSFDAGAPYFDDRTVTTLEAWSWSAATASRKSGTRTVTVGEGSDDSVSLTAFGESPFATTQRQYTWQNDWTLPLGVLSLALERREEHLATTAISPSRSGTPTRRRACTRCGTKRSRCRRTCATTTRINMAARRPAASPAATS
jgi:vitamin B12 transporter